MTSLPRRFAYYSVRPITHGDRNPPRALKAEDEHERLIDCAHLVRLESSGGSTEPFRIDDGRLLREHARLLTRERDRRSKARGAGACRGGRDEKRAQAEEFVGLYNDCVAGASLLVFTCALRRREPEDLAADQSVVSRCRGELCQLLTNEAHLRTIVLIRGEHTHFVSDGRPEPPASRRLSQRHAYGFRVAEFAGAHGATNGMSSESFSSATRLGRRTRRPSLHARAEALPLSGALVRRRGGQPRSRRA